MWSIRRVIKAFRALEAHDYSSLQCCLPVTIAREVYQWGLDHIPDSELAEDGRETDIHVTLKYGLHDHDPYVVRRIFLNQKPIEIVLGQISIFESSDADVVKIEIISPELCRLNRLVSGTFEHTDTHPQYVPHVTLAYVKKGFGQKYVGLKDFEGKKVALDSILFSGNDNRRTLIPLL